MKKESAKAKRRTRFLGFIVTEKCYLEHYVRLVIVRVKHIVSFDLSYFIE